MFGGHLVKITIAEDPATMRALRNFAKGNAVAYHAHQKIWIDSMLIRRMGDPFLIDLYFLEWYLFFFLHVFGLFV